MYKHFINCIVLKDSVLENFKPLTIYMYMLRKDI